MSEFLKVYKVFYRCLTNVIIIFAVITAAAYLSGIRVYCVRSASMGDSVPLGSLCFVSTYTSYESIVPGDIIAFSANDDLRVTHRAVKIDKDGIITKGDNNIFPDVSKVSKNQFFGRTLFSIPNIGVIIELFHTSKGIIFLSFMLGLLFLSGILYKIKFSGKNQKHISPGDQH